ncbi:MAG TPA: hypothetical protein VHU85_12235 [Acidimicrobiales bacterium]|nr:hypothetical protein [Acidimicrobiales bacterium]
MDAKVDAGAVRQVTVKLSELAATVNRINDEWSPTAELLEASRSIQNALVVLHDWNGG